MFRFNFQQLEWKDPYMAISERGTWNKMIELNDHTFIFFPANCGYFRNINDIIKLLGHQFKTGCSIQNLQESL